MASAKDDAGLQQIQMTVKLHLVPIEVLPIQTRQQHIPVPETSLVGQVVDREQTGNAIVERYVSMFDLQIGRNQTGLPVIAVQYIDRNTECA